MKVGREIFGVAEEILGSGLGDLVEGQTSVF